MTSIARGLACSSSSQPGRWWKISALLVALLFLAIGLACGRKGDPHPKSDISSALANPPPPVERSNSPAELR